MRNVEVTCNRCKKKACAVDFGDIPRGWLYLKGTWVMPKGDESTMAVEIDLCDECSKFFDGITLYNKPVKN